MSDKTNITSGNWREKLNRRISCIIITIDPYYSHIVYTIDKEIPRYNIILSTYLWRYFSYVWKLFWYLRYARDRRQSCVLRKKDKNVLTHISFSSIKNKHSEKISKISFIHNSWNFWSRIAKINCNMLNKATIKIFLCNRKNCMIKSKCTLIGAYPLHISA